MATPIARTLMKSIFEIRIHSLQHINRYVGNGVANVVLEVCYGSVVDRHKPGISNNPIKRNRMESNLESVLAIGDRL